MKIYNCKKILVFLLGALVSVGCTELYHTSYDEVISEQFEPTEKDIPALIGSAYTQWRACMLDFDGVWRYQEITGDQVIIPARPNGWVDGGLYRRAHEHTWTETENWTRGLWTRMYTGITNCNRLIDQINSGYIPISGGQEVVSALIAELRTLRASYYYLLCDFFGNVPISTKFDGVPAGFLPEQSTRKQVYDFILAEITECLPLLSKARDQSTYARFNEWAARTLLAKMYLNAEVYTGVPEWEKCIEQCNLIINSGVGYGLEPIQKNVFVTENQNSIEIIFGLAVDPDYTTGWNAFDHHMQTLPAGLQYKYNITMEPWGGMCAVPQFIDTFDPDDSRYSDNFIYGPQYTLAGEPILITTGNFIGDPMDFVNEVNSIAQSEQNQGVRFEKYEIGLGSSNCLSNDFVVFRYADVLMMKAECLLRTGRADDAAALVTEVRERSFTKAPEKAVVTGAELMAGSVYDYGIRDNREIPANTFEGGEDIQYGRFLDELAWEFNQEGRRRQDMIRFGVFTEKSWFSHAPNGDHRALFPIPIREMEANGNLVQNPGYTGL